MNRHRYFEFQCELASCGQLTEKEFREFQSHARECLECANRMHQMCRVNGGILDALNTKGLRYKVPPGSSLRFAQKAREEGIPVKSSPELTIHLRLASASFAILLLIGLCYLALNNFRTTDTARIASVDPVLSINNKTSTDSGPGISLTLASPATREISIHVKSRKRLAVLNRSIRSVAPEFRFPLTDVASGGVPSSIFKTSSAKVSQILLTYPKPIGSLPDWFRDGPMIANVRPVRFHLILEKNSACSAANQPEYYSFENGICFEPRLAFLTKEDMFRVAGIAPAN